MPSITKTKNQLSWMRRLVLVTVTTSLLSVFILNEQWTELAVIANGVVCTGVTIWKAWLFKQFHAFSLSRALSWDAVAEVGTYLICMTFAIGRFFNVVEDWGYQVTASLNDLIYLANTLTTMNIAKAVVDIQEGEK